MVYVLRARRGRAFRDGSKTVSIGTSRKALSKCGQRRFVTAYPIGAADWAESPGEISQPCLAMWAHGPANSSKQKEFSLDKFRNRVGHVAARAREALTTKRNELCGRARKLAGTSTQNFNNFVKVSRQMWRCCCRDFENSLLKIFQRQFCDRA